MTLASAACAQSVSASTSELKTQEHDDFELPPSDKLASINASESFDTFALALALLRSLRQVRVKAKHDRWLDSGAVTVLRLGFHVCRIHGSLASSESLAGWFTQSARIARMVEPEEWPTASEEAFEQMAASAPKRLIQWIRSGLLTPGHLTLAAEALGAARDDEVIPTLVDLLDSDSPLVREGVALGLGRVNAASARSHLQELARRDPSKSVRATASDVLDQLDDC